MALIPRLAFLLRKKLEELSFLVKRLAFLLMPETNKYFAWLRIRPFGLAIVFTLSFSFSILLTFACPSSIAYSQTHKTFLPFVANSVPIDITLAWDFNSEPRRGRVQNCILAIPPEITPKS